MTVTSCAGKHVTSRSIFTLVLPSRWLIFRNCFHAVNIAIKQQQYCNTVRPQLSSDRFTQHMTSQTWRLKRLFLNYSFAFNTRYEHFHNTELQYSAYLSQILWYKRNFFFFANVLWSDRFKMGVTSHLLSRWLYFVLTNQFLQ